MIAVKILFDENFPSDLTYTIEGETIIDNNDRERIERWKHALRKNDEVAEAVQRESIRACEREG